jgi:hypothetical protein
MQHDNVNDGRAIDHGTLLDSAPSPDTAGDPEGTERRLNPQSGNRDVRITPPWISKEFDWILKDGVVLSGMSPEEVAAVRMLDANWRMRATTAVINDTIELCVPTYERRSLELRTTTEAKKIKRELLEVVSNLLNVAGNTMPEADQWFMYGIGMQLVAQGAKETASAVRFALKAEDWQRRLNSQKDTETDGPTSMLERARSQALRGAALIDATLEAYNEMVTDEQATSLKVNFKSGAFTALGIEASRHQKDFDHPGKADTRVHASAGAAGKLFGDFFGTD